MGRASANGMSGAIIYTKDQDWSMWPAFEELVRDAREARFVGKRYREILNMKDHYRETGSYDRQRFAELREQVDERYRNHLKRK